MERTIKIDRYYGSLKGMMSKYERLARSDAFTGSSVQDYETWKKKTRATLRGLLGLDRMEECPLQPQLLEKVEVKDGIIREKVLLQVEPETYMPVYILIPPSKSDEKQNCFMALPGHMGAGKYSVAGCDEIPAVKDSIERFNYDYGMQLAKMGYVALCPDCRGFGERRDESLQNDTEDAFLNSTCFHLAHMAEPLGETVAGMCTWDAMRLLDYIYERDEWNLDTVGCLGFSGGGMQTLWVSAMDDRIKQAVISGYLYGYKDSLLLLNDNCSCNYVPHLWEHFDMGDIASLIAPRPLLVQSCRDDHLNGPRGLQNVSEQMDIVRNAYRLYQKEEYLIHDVREGEHCWHKEPLQETLPFFETCLMPEKIYVSSDSEHPGDFVCVMDALNSIPENNQKSVTIFIAPGVYHEKITINKPFVTLEGIGEKSEDTVLTFDDYAFYMMEDGMKRGTFRSYSVFIDAHDVTLKNLTIENASGDSLTHGQAIALYADGDRLTIDSCRLLGHQDTLFTGPLPPKEIEKNGFIGPKQFAPRINGRQYYRNCYICGDIDFIFGSATAFFEDCIIESLRHFPKEAEEENGDSQKEDSGQEKIQGYVTAASTPEGQDYGYVFLNCRFISEECPPDTVYLGRPWREYAKTVFIHCSFGGHIHPELFHDWNKKNAHETVLYGVYRCEKNLSEMFPERAEFVQILGKEQADYFSKECVLSGVDRWKR